MVASFALLPLLLLAAPPGAPSVEASAAEARDAGVGLPRGWFVAGTDPQSYTVSAGQGQCDERAALLRSVDGAQPRGSVTAMQLFRADRYRGKRVRFSGTTATRLGEGWSGLWIRVDAADRRTLAFDTMQRRPLKGVTGCQTSAVVTDVAPEAAFIALGLFLDGQGLAELSKISLQVVDPDLVASTAAQPAAGPHDQPVIGRVGETWFGERTVAGYLNEVTKGTWRWSDDTSATFDGKTLTYHQGEAPPALRGFEPVVAPRQGTFTLRRDGAATLIEGTWGTVARSYPVRIRYDRQAVDMAWGFYERHLVRDPDQPKQLEAGCVLYSRRNPKALSYDDALTLCGVALEASPPVPQTVIAFLAQGFNRFSITDPAGLFAGTPSGQPPPSPSLAVPRPDAPGGAHSSSGPAPSLTTPKDR